MKQPPSKYKSLGRANGLSYHGGPYFDDIFFLFFKLCCFGSLDEDKEKKGVMANSTELDAGISRLSA